MPGDDLELSVLSPARDGLGFVAGFVVTEKRIIAAGGTTREGPMILASSNARHFESMPPPREHGLRDILLAGDGIWVCGEYGYLAVSRDDGASWKTLETRTEQCLFGLAMGTDGSVWTTGDAGFVAHVVGDKVDRIDFQTTTRLASVYVVKETVVALGGDGFVYRWSAGDLIRMATGSQQPLTALHVTKGGSWIVIGDGGFIARSPDGAWFSRVRPNVTIDLEAIGACASGPIVVVGDRGTVLVSRDDGRSWRQYPTTTLSHLWSVERFGAGVLIGGDDGLVLRLAPQGDATWHDRINVFGGTKPLDSVFAEGPVGFIAKGLATYLEAIAPIEASGVSIIRNDDLGDDDEDNEDDEPDDDELDAIEDEEEEGEGDREAFEALSMPGDADDFEAIYGVPLAPEAASFFGAVASADPWSSFEELRLDTELLPDVGDKNLFELLVRRDQHAYLGTGLVEAFCGVFCIGSLGNGDTYHMEIYEWDGGRQVLHYDHDDHAFTGVFADSLDSLAYLAALKLASETDKISAETYGIGLRKLRGKVAPTWHFSIKDDDPGFEPLDAKRRDTEFFFYRSRWILALLKNDGVTDIEDIPRLFNADFNQVVPQDQLPARFEACEKFNPTALYSMWRAYLFDEPELGRYLDIARRHKARLVRDAAKLIDELRTGRNELGTITDVRAHLEKFRALDLDPRRADARKAEAEARAKLEASRKQEIEAELARTPMTSWSELAWRWLDDGVAHRALLARLDERPDLAGQIAALDALRELGDDDREVTLPRLANELAGELEAVLVGSLVRGDALEGVLPRPEELDDADLDDDDADSDSDADADDADDEDDDENEADEADEDDEDDEDENEDEDEDEDDEDEADEPEALGWDAIDAALQPLYHGEEPHAHYGTVLPYMLGGNDPLHGISVYLREEPVPHFHFVTYGFTDLFEKETDDPDESGFGFELTFRLGRAADDKEIPNWALNFLQNLARYVFGTGNQFNVGHKMGLNGPIASGQETKITAILFAADPELGEFESEYGKARFLQVVGITDDEYKLIQEWSTNGLVEMLGQKLPYLVTDLGRDSVLADPTIAVEVKRRVDAEGSSEDLTFAGDMRLDVSKTSGEVRIEMGALYAAALPRAMRGRLRHGRPYTLRGRDAEVHLRSGDKTSYEVKQTELELVLSPPVVAEIEARLAHAMAGEFRFETWPQLRIVVTPTIIRDPEGKAIEVRGVSEDEAKRIIHEDAHEHDHDHDHGDDDDHHHDDEDEHEHDDDGPPPDREKIRAALAMTTRALKLQPDDDDAQYTHAMLLLDADRAGIRGTMNELLTALPSYTVSNQLNIVTRLGTRGHKRFGEALDRLIERELPEKVMGESSTSVGGGQIASYGDVAEDLFTQLGDATLKHAPDRMNRLARIMPMSVQLYANLAYKAIQADRRDEALALYDRLLAFPVPEDGDDRTNYLRAMNNACVQAHAAKAYELAVRIADRAQPYAHENPYIYHSAACAYAAVGAFSKAFEQVKLAVEHDYDHLEKVESDTDLGELLEWPDFKALFRDWRAGKEGN